MTRKSGVVFLWGSYHAAFGAADLTPRASTGSVGVGELELQAIHVHAQYGVFRSATGDHPAPRGDQSLIQDFVQFGGRVWSLMKMDSGAGTMGRVWDAIMVWVTSADVCRICL